MHTKDGTNGNQLQQMVPMEKLPLTSNVPNNQQPECTKFETVLIGQLEVNSGNRTSGLKI